MTQNILINGLSEQSLPANDRGLAYGHGLFETIALNGSQPVAWQAHLARLKEGAARIAIPLPDNIDQLLEEDLSCLLAQQSSDRSSDKSSDISSEQDHSVQRQVLKITITRGCGGRGYAVDDTVSINRVVQLSAFPQYPDNPAENGIVVRLCRTSLALAPQLAGIKHLNRLEQVLARAEWHDVSIREGLVLDTEGFLVEGTMSNLFWSQGGVLYTPQLDRCGVNGIIRQRIISIASQHGIALHQGLFTPEVLLVADEVFVCNSIIGIWPVTGTVLPQNQRPEWLVGPITRMLQSQLSAEGIY
ncbi:aminodeoxychorismate lyase [uncultured Amphritea sp.]|uniref:aminodeoxychorismate lyase n=1 Tax=uncultured Amphritea sp. TaxID=981605 RepID=UPI0026169226|nr:aminodeoxychorismate lyase [uncultured Amphritea sp.]